MLSNLYRLAMAATAALFVLPASAQVRDPGSSVYSDGGYVSLRVDANMLSQNGCGEVTSSRRGAPSGMQAIQDAVYATVTVDMTAGCTGSPKVLRSMFPMSGMPNVPTVHIYFVSTTGKVLKSEKVGIQH